MKLTPLKVLIETYTMEDLEAFEDYQMEVERSKDLGIVAPERPKIKEPEYKTKNYNLEFYILDSWFADWDKDRECPIIVVTWFHSQTSNLLVMNVQMKETEWKELLLTLGYT